MAILFKQSRRKEKIFLWSVIIVVVLVLFSISLFIFPPFQNSSLMSKEEIFGQYDAKIDLGLIDSEQVKNLDVFSGAITTEFTFIAKDKNGKQVTGTIAALDKSEATSLLTNKGLDVLSIEESHVIKNNPFSPYYQSK